jgi:hypothetical protein
MRLTDLNPKWILPTSLWSSPDPYYVAIKFDCPHCRTQRLVCFFEPPIDPSGLKAKYGWSEFDKDKPKWKRRGDTFETLTLEPSVNFDSTGHFHGHITNGEVISA